MLFLVDENMPRSIVAKLRQRGHDVLSAKESLRGDDDQTILARAQLEMRIVITQDKDFGELAFRIGLPASCGVILFRLNGEDPEVDNLRILEVIDSQTDWAGLFAVATNERLRIRPLPT